MKWRFVISIIIVPHSNGILSLVQRLDNATFLYWGLRVSASCTDSVVHPE